MGFLTLQHNLNKQPHAVLRTTPIDPSHNGLLVSVIVKVLCREWTEYDAIL